ncbi:MAG: SirB2 family protein [Colwellia sp.]
MKHLHMTLAVISILLFSLRFIWTLANSKQLQKKWVKISPHIIDTFLFSIGVYLAFVYYINPLEQLWLAEKLLAIVAYIFTGYYTLKLARNRTMQIIGYIGAMGWVMLIVRLAMTKTPVFFV